MLDLLACELSKLKRRKYAWLAVLAALLSPIPVALMACTPEGIVKSGGPAAAFDGLYQFTLGFAVEHLLPCVLGVLAAVLFFMERDYDTFKSLRTIPVNSTQLVLAKVAMLFLYGVAFCVATALSVAACGAFLLEIHGMAYKLFAAAEMGVFITAGTLPLVVLVAFFSRTYVFSILMCVFYSVLGLIINNMLSQLPKALAWAYPISLTNLWTGGALVHHGWVLNLAQLGHLIPSTAQTAAILGGGAVVSVLLIDHLYKRRGE